MTVAAEAERIARLFHDTYEQLAPGFGYETREASAVPWNEVPAENRALMESVVRALLTRKVIFSHPCNPGAVERKP